MRRTMRWINDSTLVRMALCIALLIVALPSFARAQEQDVYPLDASGENSVFEARVVAVLNERTIRKENGAEQIQQNLKLLALDGPKAGEEIVYVGISDTVVEAAGAYGVGDRVIVHANASPEGTVYYVTDFVRRSRLYALAALFALTVIAIGRSKGVRSLIGLGASFGIILFVVLPKILAGGNPLMWALIGACGILAVIIYLSEGWNRSSHLAMASVVLSLAVTLLLSMAVAGWTRLTGFASEETFFLLGVGSIVDFRGLLLAGMLIGAVGVLDDVIVGQIEAAKQIAEANPNLPPGRIFSMAYRVGNAHLGAMVNTLFLTYAGASLPLLLLFSVKQEPFLTFSQVMNNELIATEIVRSLVGGIGVALSMPIATYFGAYGMKRASRVPDTSIRSCQQ